MEILNESDFKSFRSYAAKVKAVYKLDIVEYNIRYKNFEIPKCKHCNKDAKYNKALNFRKTCGSKDCKRKEQSLRKHSDETKNKMRVKRLEYMKANPEKTAWRKSNMSFPESVVYEWFKTCNEFIIEREKSFYPFHADFSIINANVVIEIDGSQHLIEERKNKDEIKDSLIVSNGWRVIRIPAIEVLENFESVKYKILNFIESGGIIEKSIYVSNKEKQRKLEIEQYKIKIKAKQDKINNSINSILESGIDFKRFGWVNKVSTILGITPQNVSRWMKRNMPDHYSICYKRNNITIFKNKKK